MTTITTKKQEELTCGTVVSEGSRREELRSAAIIGHKQTGLDNSLPSVPAVIPAA